MTAETRRHVVSVESVKAVSSHCVGRVDEMDVDYYQHDKLHVSFFICSVVDRYVRLRVLHGRPSKEL